MKEQVRKADIIEEIRDKGESFRTEVPPYAWSRIASRLENDHSKKEISFYKWWYNAAMAIIAIGVLVLFGVMINQNNNTSTSIDSYSNSIRELHVSNNSYPVYDIHQLQKAYLQLEIPAELKETEISDYKTIRNL